MGSDSNDRRVIQLPIEPGLICLRGPDRTRVDLPAGPESQAAAL